MNRCAGSTILALAALLAVARPARAELIYRYEAVEAGGLPIRYLLGTNDAGDLVGSALDASSGLIGFLRAGGTTATWANPSFLTYPTDINNSGAISGVLIPTTPGFPRSFLRDSTGSEVPFAFPGALGTVLFGVNDAGVLSGFSIDAVGRRGFIADPSADLYRTIDLPGASETFLYQGNDRGQFGASYIIGGGAQQAAIYEPDGTFTLIPSPDGKPSLVSSINDFGDAIVFTLDPLGVRDFGSFVRDARTGATVELRFPGALETYGWEIDNTGRVIGYYQNPDGTYGGFAATAVPEPGSLTLAVIGLVAGTAIARREARRAKGGDR